MPLPLLPVPVFVAWLQLLLTMRHWSPSTFDTTCWDRELWLLQRRTQVNCHVSFKQVHGRNNHMARVNTRGVFATPSSRAPRDVRGKTLPVRPSACCVHLPNDNKVAGVVSAWVRAGHRPLCLWSFWKPHGLGRAAVG